jgi:sterol desaturase/sphingolipid hydroxylase (fatty acid hydroxylase superfamily)
MERLISTPATHHAHHADTDDDGVGHYKGNFGNMFFIWDIILVPASSQDSIFSLWYQTLQTGRMVCAIFMADIQIKKRRQ